MTIHCTPHVVITFIPFLLFNTFLICSSFRSIKSGVLWSHCPQAKRRQWSLRCIRGMRATLFLPHHLLSSFSSLSALAYKRWKINTLVQRKPVLQAHVDQTPQSSHTRVERHVQPPQPYKRFQLVNVWRPISNTVCLSPLILFASSFSPHLLLIVWHPSLHRCMIILSQCVSLVQWT